MQDIKAKIEIMMHDDAPDFKIAKLLKQDIKNYFETLEESFATNSGKDFLVKHTKKIDTLVQMVYKIAMRSTFGTFMPMKNTLPITLVALGSYGREQLCVHSDIDLMIVYKETKGYNSKEMIEKILYILWDAGVKLGHRVHEIDEIFEVSNTHITIKTSMIESRFVEGSKQLWMQTQNELDKIRHHQQDDFIRAKVEELRQLHQRFPMTMQPNLKEGVGGFRHANLVYWLGNILHHVDRIKDLPTEIVAENEYKEFHGALDFLFRVRSALHLSRKKKEDRLRLELIPEVAKYLGYRDDLQEHMKFAKKVTASLKIIKLYSIIWIDALTHLDQTSTLRPKKNRNTYNALLTQLCNAGEQPFSVHPTFLRALNGSIKPTSLDETGLYPTIHQIFFQSQTHTIIQTLLDVRLLGYTIPPMKQIINLPQFDGYHDYTVGIHSLKALYFLENITDTTLQTIYHNLSQQNKALIKLVTLVHDAGKGRKEAHEIVGARLFKVFAQKLSMSGKDIKIGSSLIINHSQMSRVAQREDLHTEQTILKFTALFPSQLELDLIYLLTYADMKAVAEGIYNNFNERLLRTLYYQSCIALSHGKKLYETSKRLKKEKTLQKEEKFKILPRSLQKKILNIPSDLLFMKYPPLKIIEITTTAVALKEYTFSINNNNFLTLEIIRKDNLDVSYLLHELSRLDIVHMDICKLFNGIKYFKIEFNEVIDESEMTLIEDIIYKALNKVHQLNLTPPNIDKKNIIIDCEHSKEHATMQLNCANQKGLLSYIINIFDKIGIDICSAKIHTKSNRVNDLFLIEKNRNFCNNTDRIIKELTEN